MPLDSVDLLLRAGRVICPDQAAAQEVAVRDGLIVAIGSGLPVNARQTLDFPGATILPGLIDLHAHPACSGSKYGVDPDREFLTRGVTTVLSQGDAGAGNWAEYRKSTLDVCKTRVRMAINLSVRGESMTAGCFENLADADVDACIQTIESARDVIWGIAVNVSEIGCAGSDPHEIVRRALAVAEATDKPLLYGMHRTDRWPLAEQLAQLRSGDVVTYCFRPAPSSIIENGHIHPAAREARSRGVLFDLGHGMQSFVFSIAEAALADGFPPDTISTDQYAKHIGPKPQHDLPRTMSKLLAAGMSEAEVFAAVTTRPAKILGIADEVGVLTVGRGADIAVLQWNEDALPLVDVQGTSRPGGCWEPIVTVRAAKVYAVSPL